MVRDFIIITIIISDMEPLRRFQEISRSSFVIGIIMCLSNLNVLDCHESQHSTVADSQLEVLSKQTSYLHQARNPGDNMVLDDSKLHDNVKHKMSVISYSTVEDAKDSIDGSKDINDNKSDMIKSFKDLKNFLVRKAKSKRLSSIISNSLNIYKQENNQTSFLEKVNAKSNRGSVREESKINISLEDNEKVNQNNKESHSFVNGSENLETIQNVGVTKIPNKRKRGFPDPDSCETEATEIDLTFTEHIDTDTSSYQLTCTGRVTINKCEGLCNSSWTPSVNHYDGFKRVSYTLLRNSYTMGCPPVRGDNPRALASGLSYVQVDKCGITILYHLHQCRPCTSQNILC